MPHSWKGVIAGFLATIVMSLVFVGFDSAELFPQLNVVSLIDRLGSIGRTAAWFDHFIVGTLLWGPIFAGFEATTSEKRPRWQKGLIFGFLTWILMMLIFMPVVGGGLFGLRIGTAEPIGMLFMSLVYGLALGVFFGLLDKQFPTKTLISEEPPLPEMAQFKD